MGRRLPRNGHSICSLWRRNSVRLGGGLYWVSWDVVEEVMEEVEEVGWCQSYIDRSFRWV